MILNADFDDHKNEKNISDLKKKKYHSEILINTKINIDVLKKKFFNSVKDDEQILWVWFITDNKFLSNIIGSLEIHSILENYKYIYFFLKQI